MTGSAAHFGLGPFSRADVVRVVWPNGSYQNLAFRTSDSMALAANQLIVEEQSLKGSCPYLYAWNGERFEFVTDVLWRSALGMPLAENIMAEHVPADDYYKVAGELLEPRGDAYVLQFTEELWEVAYFDYCRILVVDHPVGTQIFVDEKSSAPPYAPFEIYQVREPRPVWRAIDHRGRDVSGLLARGDGRFVSDFAKTRYQGIVEDHELVLDLGPFDPDAELRLYLVGWLWPTDASTNVAVSQNPTVRVRPPVLSVIDRSGRWRPVDRTVGFPSGKNKTIVVDLTGLFEADDHRVRLSTNLAIFWDQVFMTVGGQTFEMRVTELPVRSADLHERGYSQAFRRVPEGPDIPEYGIPDHDRQWRDLIGHYTRFGDVVPLLAAADGMYAIVGAGDEVTLEFDAGLPPALDEGWARDFVIHTDGWVKDADLNGAASKTVAPLPFRGMSAYPYSAGESPPDTAANRDYLETYHTRFRDQAPFRAKLVGQPDRFAARADHE